MPVKKKDTTCPAEDFFGHKQLYLPKIHARGVQTANAQQLSTLASLDIVPAGFPTTQKVGHLFALIDVLTAYNLTLRHSASSTVRHSTHNAEFVTKSGW